MFRAACPSLLALLSACSVSPTGNAQTNAVDPAITAALADPIMADPMLDRRANRDVLRPDDEPYRAMSPPGSLATMRGAAASTLVARTGGFPGCDRNVRYSYGWADRLSRDLTLPPAAQVSEAAGSNTATCQLRLVAYAVALSPDATLELYRQKASAGGYALEEAAALLSARRRDGTAFTVSVTADGSGSGSLVDLATNRGR